MKKYILTSFLGVTLIMGGFAPIFVSTMHAQEAEANSCPATISFTKTGGNSTIDVSDTYDFATTNVAWSDDASKIAVVNVPNADGSLGGTIYVGLPDTGVANSDNIEAAYRVSPLSEFSIDVTPRDLTEEEESEMEFGNGFWDGYERATEYEGWTEANGLAQYHDSFARIDGLSGTFDANWGTSFDTLALDYTCESPADEEEPSSNGGNNTDEREETARPRGTVRNNGGNGVFTGTVLGVSDSNDRSTGTVLGAEDTNVLAQAINNVNDTPTPAPAALAQTGHGVPFMVILMSLVAMIGAVVRFRTFRA